MEELRPGRRGTAALTVTDADTAIAWRSGDVEVLATPRVLALCEEAAVAAVAGSFPADTTTVGTWAELEHLQPSRVGDAVTADAEVTAVDGRRLEFDVVVRSGDAEVARGRHRRVVVRRERFA